MTWHLQDMYFQNKLPEVFEKLMMAARTADQKHGWHLLDQK